MHLVRQIYNKAPPPWFGRRCGGGSGGGSGGESGDSKSEGGSGGGGEGGDGQMVADQTLARSAKWIEL